jgi:hypothetical protein
LSFRLPAEGGDVEGPEVALAKKHACGGANCPEDTWNKPRDVERVLRARKTLTVETRQGGTLPESELVKRLEAGSIAICRITGSDFHVVSAHRAVAVTATTYQYHVYDSLGAYTSEDKTSDWVRSGTIFLVDAS